MKKPMRIRALGILEPPGYDARVQPGWEGDVPAEYAAMVCGRRLAEPVASKPVERAEKRPKRPAEER